MGVLSCSAGVLAVVAATGVATAAAGDFSGGGLSLGLGTGSPNSVDAASALARDLSVDDETGNYTFIMQGFYQADRFRLGAAFQGQVWGGANVGDQEPKDSAAGVVAAIGGLYGTFTFRHDRVLLNAGGTVGAGRCLLGYSLGNSGPDEKESVSTFYLEPQVSVGVATCRWFGAEFQLSTPIYLLTEDFVLTYDGQTYAVQGSDLAGVQFCMKLTFGLIASP